MTRHTETTPSAPSSTLPVSGPHLYHGSCVCGAIRYEVTIDWAAGTNRCNCTLCTKASLWNAVVKPEAFRLLQGEDSLSDFQRHGKFGHYLFCRHCGVRAFSRGDAPWTGGAYVAVNVTCLDDADLTGVEIRTYDGLHDKWENPAISRFLG